VTPAIRGRGAPTPDASQHLAPPLFLRRCVMPHASKRAEHYRDLAERYLRLAASTDHSNHYLRIAVHYSALAEAEELKTARWRRMAAGINRLTEFNRTAKRY
jgi:hypothetical protein